MELPPLNNIVYHPVHAQLLGSLIEDIKSSFKNRNINFQNSYNQGVLKELKYLKKVSDESQRIIKQIIQNYSKEIDLPVKEIINLLLFKSQRNFKAHGFIEYFIKDVLSNICNENDLVGYIENEHNVQVILDNHEKDVLLKLAHVNIEQRREILGSAAKKYFYFYKSLILFTFRQSILDKNFDGPREPAHNNDGPLRMSINDRYKVCF